jgi:hypothetical protein
MKVRTKFVLCFIPYNVSSQQSLTTETKSSWSPQPCNQIDTIHVSVGAADSTNGARATLQMQRHDCHLQLEVRFLRCLHCQWRHPCIVIIVTVISTEILSWNINEKNRVVPLVLQMYTDVYSSKYHKIHRTSESYAKSWAPNYHHHHHRHHYHYYSLLLNYKLLSLVYLKQFHLHFLFTSASKPALGPTQPPIQWVPGTVPGVRAAGAWSWKLTSI